MLKIYIYWHKCWCYRCGTGRDGTTSEDSATQLLICEPLSFAIYGSLQLGICWLFELAQLGLSNGLKMMKWVVSVHCPSCCWSRLCLEKVLTAKAGAPRPPRRSPPPPPVTRSTIQVQVQVKAWVCTTNSMFSQKAAILLVKVQARPRNNRAASSKSKFTFTKSKAILCNRHQHYNESKWKHCTSFHLDSRESSRHRNKHFRISNLWSPFRCHRHQGGCH